MTRTSSAKIGETFIVDLSSNAGPTGYDRKVTTSSGVQYLNYIVVSTDNLPDGSQIKNYSFSSSPGALHIPPVGACRIGNGVW